MIVKSLESDWRPKIRKSLTVLDSRNCRVTCKKHTRGVDVKISPEVVTQAAAMLNEGFIHQLIGFDVIARAFAKDNPGFLNYEIKLPILGKFFSSLGQETMAKYPNTLIANSFLVNVRNYNVIFNTEPHIHTPPSLLEQQRCLTMLAYESTRFLLSDGGLQFKRLYGYDCPVVDGNTRPGVDGGTFFLLDQDGLESSGEMFQPSYREDSAFIFVDGLVAHHGCGVVLNKDGEKNSYPSRYITAFCSYHLPLTDSHIRFAYDQDTQNTFSMLDYSETL